MKFLGKGYKTLSVISDGVSTILLDLTNDSQVIPVGEEGENYTYATTTANLYEGNILITSNVTYTIEEIGQVEGIWNEQTRTYIVTNMYDDVANVKIKATYKGTDYEANFVLSKIYNGEDTVLIQLTNDRHIFVSDFNGEVPTSQSVITRMVTYSSCYFKSTY